MEALTAHLTRLVGLTAAVCATAAILTMPALADSGSAMVSGIERQLYAPTGPTDPSALRDSSTSVGHLGIQRLGVATDPADLRDSSTSPGHLGAWAREGEAPVSGIEREIAAGTTAYASPLRDNSTDAGHLGRTQAASGSFTEPADGFGWGSVGAGAGAVALVALMAVVVLVAFRKSRHEPRRA